MTQIRYDRPTRRETAVIVRGKPLVIECLPRMCVLRRKGCRYGYEIHWETVYMEAARLEAERQRAERRRRREEKRKLGRGDN